MGQIKTLMSKNLILVVGGIVVVLVVDIVLVVEHPSLGVVVDGMLLPLDPLDVDIVVIGDDEVIDEGMVDEGMVDEGMVDEVIMVEVKAMDPNGGKNKWFLPIHRQP